jgi:hypothetical protein
MIGISKDFNLVIKNSIKVKFLTFLITLFGLALGFVFLQVQANS